MSGLPAPSAVTDVWPRGIGSSGPTPFGGGATGLPTVNNSNLPLNTTTFLGNRPLNGAQASRTPFPSLGQTGGLPPPVPQPPLTPFPSIRQPTGTTSNSLLSNNYNTANNLPSMNPMATSLMQNQLTAQNEISNRRLTQLEDENALRRNATAKITQMGAQVLQGQMDVQEQILHYQLMLEQCMEALDHQNYLLNDQAEEVALVRAKMRHFEYLMDALKLSKEGNNLMRSMSGDGNCFDANRLCCRDPLALPAPSTSPFFAGGPTRVTSSTFQPFNPRYRSPNTRAAAAATLNDRRSTATTPTGNTLKPTAVNRPTRRYGGAKQ